MGKKTITSFIYDGMLEWYLRVPYSNVGVVYKPDAFYSKYFSKREYTLQDVIDKRLEIMKQLERDGKRFVTENTPRFITAKKIEDDERNGLYEKLLKKHS